MKYGLIGILAIFVASAFVLSTASGGSLDKVVGLDSDVCAASGHGPRGPPSHSHHNATDNKTHEGEKNEAQADRVLLAGGGGWHAVNVSGMIYKDTFGVLINGDPGNWSKSSFVFQARDQNATIRAVNFTNIVFDNTTVANMTYVHAWGWAICNKTEGFWFHLVLRDNGTRTNDLLDLALYKDVGGSWTMDETTPVLHWVFDGLDGGNIWVGAAQEESDECVGTGQEESEDNGDHDATNDDAGDDGIDDANDNEKSMAGGGGWRAINVSGTIYKDTFGVVVKRDSDNNCSGSLVFQARDQNATLHALNFTGVVFDNTTVANMTYVRATGWASFNKTTGYWFQLVLKDNGTRTNDLFDLALYKDVDGKWTMDETTPVLHWVFDGLDGGNIWVGTGQEESEDDADHDATDDDAGDDGIDDANDNEKSMAGGGGWHIINMSGVIYKDTFGVHINGDADRWNASSLLFQARDQNATIHAVNFTKIVFDNTTVVNLTFVHAWGWAICNKTEGFWFHLVLMDNGTKSNDMFDLALYADSDKDWTMDETTPLVQWVFDGLDGGNI